jgi:hypothetical protein
MLSGHSSRRLNRKVLVINKQLLARNERYEISLHLRTCGVQLGRIMEAAQRLERIKIYFVSTLNLNIWLTGT